MSCIYKAVLLPLLLFSAPAGAQDSLATHIAYDLTTEAAVGTGDHTAFLLTANRHHALSTRANTAYLRAAVSAEHQLNRHFRLSGVVDAIGSLHADHKTYLQQCYARLWYEPFFLEAGISEPKPVLRHEELSSGSFILGTNAKPVPQVRIGMSDFWTVPLLDGWIQINLGAGYGRLLDSDYREERFSESPGVNAVYATGICYHQKHLFFRTNPTKRVFAIVGMEHVVHFGGTGYSYAGGVLTGKEKPSGLKAFANVFLPFGDGNYYKDNSMEDWIYGNHIGMMTVQIGWNITQDKLLQAYVDNPFEDGSGIRKGNGYDGLWGLQYTNKAAGPQPVRGVVAEYLQTTNQCGPLHWDKRDYPEPVKSQITDYVTGNDNYYNHSFYDNYTHYGMTPGNPLVTSPIYNKDGYTAFRDNRIKAWHLGFDGEITSRLSYLVKGSYREGWGTYDAPLPSKHHSFDALLQGTFRTGGWQFSAAYAFDRGNIVGDCSTFNIKIGYHGTIL